MSAQVLGENDRGQMKNINMTIASLLAIATLGFLGAGCKAPPPSKP